MKKCPVLLTLLTLLAICLLIPACDTKTKVVDTCGDNFLDPGEECDGSQLSVTTCTELGYYDQTETLTCQPDCTFDLSVCTGGRCGDGIIQTAHGEECDRENLANATCEGLSLGGGELGCFDSCRLDMTGCDVNAVCGDGSVAFPYEKCEPDDLLGNSCESLDFYEGELRCAENCLSLDTTGCSMRCGDGTVQSQYGETCDGSNLNGATCVSLGFSPVSGMLGCTPECAFDETLCVDKSANADLATLTVSMGSLTPGFSAGTTSYTVKVLLPVTTLTLTAAAADAYAQVVIAPSQPMSLVVGENPVTVTVTAENGAQKVYSVIVKRSLDTESLNVGVMTYVPGGTFQRDSTPTNLSVVSAFRISQHEISREQWVAVTGWTDPSNATYTSGAGDPVQRVNWYAAIAFCNRLSQLEGLTPVYAVSGVDFTTLSFAQIPTADNATWNSATANWAANGYRLPTEMEWWWAAMGADSANTGAINTTGYAKAFAGSTGSNSVGDYAWYSSNSGGTTHAPGTKLPNELGLYDMTGNVAEWLWDWSGNYPTGTLSDYRGPASGPYRMPKGTGWQGSESECPLRTRYSTYPYSQYPDIGLRVVRP
ncbi:MAG: hypothetical protein CVU65_14305 [Deltaproteobacteria bacterium HGW-Deltaproteobacteria-22]|nr:MAG: hypothetical protein CVU65_14305 [Deltaproteobacteria bacterium HGW-Deltaproteobacteria-22]